MLQWSRGLYCAIVALWGTFSASAFELQPFKDELFAYPTILEQGYSGDFLRLDYQIQRDLRDRDEVTEKRVHRRYVSSRPSWSTRDRSLTVDGRRLRYVRVGSPSTETELIVLYIHGKGGNRTQGVADWTFGGNFNRLKNLLVRNNGVYLVPDAELEAPSGLTDIVRLIDVQVRLAPNARVIVACGSMGARICSGLARMSRERLKLNALVLLGGAIDRGLARSPAVEAGLPIIFAHGSLDRVYGWRAQYEQFRVLKAKSAVYPTRFLLFETGSHGTPIRMIDWRRELNWLLARTSKQKKGLND